jgi:hypothetical protein
MIDPNQMLDHNDIMDVCLDTDEPGSSSSEASCRGFLYLKLKPFLTPCGMIFFECPMCPRQFPAREFNLHAYRSHLVIQHLHFLVYKCHAVPSAVKRCSDHEFHPCLMGTTMTDVCVSENQVASRIWLDRAMGEPKRDHIFPYLEVKRLSRSAAGEVTSSSLYICSYCRFQADTLAAYKAHVAVKHVTIKLSDLPLEQPGERQGHTVFGPRHA